MLIGNEWKNEKFGRSTEMEEDMYDDPQLKEESSIFYDDEKNKCIYFIQISISMNN